MNEPVAYMCLDTSRLRAGHCADKVLRFNKPKQAHVVDIVPLYPKQEWVGLTDEEWESMYDKFAKYQEYGAFVSGWDNFARAIEAALKEKNT